MIKIAVIAGTPVDTRMGVEYIESKNREAGYRIAEPLYLPAASDCDAQVRFQYSDYGAKRIKMDEIFDPAIEDGVRDFFIYCNSLSGAFDFETYAEEKGVNVYTPLQIYRTVAHEYNRVGVVAAHNMSAYNIEKTILEAKEDMYVIGSGNMALVSAIEAGMEPEKIAEEYGLAHLVQYMEDCGCETIILGCTHFPYFKEQMNRYCSVPLIDPADRMFEAFLNNRK